MWDSFFNGIDAPELDLLDAGGLQADGLGKVLGGWNWHFDCNLACITTHVISVPSNLVQESMVLGYVTESCALSILFQKIR